jgi:hypothetical protein
VKPVLLRVAIAVVGSSLIASYPIAAQQRAVGKRFERRQIVGGPALESAAHNSAIIRWTVNAGGGTAVHYGIVQYGTDPRKLDHWARSPNRWSRHLPNVTYRVRIDGLTPLTTYYYTVNVVQADGVDLGLKAPVNQFTTRLPP